MRIVVRVATMHGYVPPQGYRVVSHRQLEDGSYEVVLEPSGFLRSTHYGAGLRGRANCPLDPSRFYAICDSYCQGLKGRLWTLAKLKPRLQISKCNTTS
jgi:hypothetical protein